MHNRIVAAATRCGVYRGQSMHSFRRGSMQHRHYVLGEDSAAVGALAKIQTPAITARYLNPCRSRAKLQKLAAAAKYGPPGPMPALTKRKGVAPAVLPSPALPIASPSPVSLPWKLRCRAALPMPVACPPSLPLPWRLRPKAASACPS